jgi:predicted amidohydrolase YtcJ
MWRGHFAWILAIALACGGGGGGGNGERPTVPPPTGVTVLHNAGAVLPERNASAIIISNGKITAVGGDELVGRAGPSARVVDLDGATVLPGLRDAHVHLSMLGKRLLGRQIDLSATKSVDEVKAKVALWIRERHVPNGAWVYGAEWNERRWTTSELPRSTAPLDEAAPSNPVLLRRVDGHTGWANSRALRLAGITRETPDPAGGVIVRDASGEPTGVVLDAAQALVARHLPPESQGDIEEECAAAMDACARAGLVEVHVAGIGIREERALRHLAETGRMPVRVYAMLSAERPDLDDRLAIPPVIEPIGGRLTIRAVKAFADGAASVHGAWMLAPYHDQPSNRGIQRITAANLERLAQVCVARGYQLAVHAIGDAAVREVLDVYERIHAGRGDVRFRIEHATYIDPSDLPRFRDLSVIASMQPTAGGEARVHDLIGGERMGEFQPWHALLETGAHVAFGSDVPAILDERPLTGLANALAGHRTSFEQALRAYTQEPAYASFTDKQRGRIVPGMDADLTIVKADVAGIAAGDPKRLAKAEIATTYVAGVPTR